MRKLINPLDNPADRPYIEGMKTTRNNGLISQATEELARARATGDAKRIAFKEGTLAEAIRLRAHR